MPQKSSYAAAGVDIDVMMQALKNARGDILSTRTADVVSEIGTFGGLFRAPKGDSLLVSSIDGVGTKLKVAHLAGRHDTVGQDLVNHCVNDILVQGARPLFFMDYVGAAQLEASLFAQVVKGLCKACRANDCALLGGETAEMPGLYPKSEYDLVGAIVGVVPRRKLITGESIRAGDVILGLPSGGLQTNGYSLARKVIFRTAKLKIDDELPGTGASVANVLLATHKSFLKPVMALMETVNVRGMAHITGGGLVDNVPRVLPKGLSAVFDRSSWKVPPVFLFIQEQGKVDHEEMFRVFNMGIGYTIIVRPKDADGALAALKKQRAGARVIGHIEAGGVPCRFVN